MVLYLLLGRGLQSERFRPRSNPGTGRARYLPSVHDDSAVLAHGRPKTFVVGRGQKEDAKLGSTSEEVSNDASAALALDGL